MMFKKALTKSGRRILKAIKNISSARLAKKLQYQQQQQQLIQMQMQQQLQIQQEQEANWAIEARLQEMDRLSVASSSLPSLDAKSIDTYVTYVADGYYAEDVCCCCHCNEMDENLRNENLENEMMR